jgi:hypothetical protein
MKTKDEVCSKLETFISAVVPQYKGSLVEFRSDNGGEFKNSRVSQLLSSNGVRQSFTPKYTPQLNGIAERFNRTLTNMARSFMVDSQLSHEFWPYAYDTANYIRNRLPALPLPDYMSPYECLTHTVPNLDRLRVFGCSCFALIQPRSSAGIQHNSRKGTFLGYDPNSIMYRVLNWDTGKIEVTSDVTFNETMNDLKTSPYVVKSGIDMDTIHRLVDDRESPSSNPVPHAVTRLPTPVASEPSASTRKSSRVPCPPIRLTTDKLGWWGHKNLALIENYVLTHFSTDRLVPTSYTQATTCADKELWVDSMKKEMSAVEALGTMKIVDRPRGVNVLPSKFIYKIKEDEKGDIKEYKSRWVPLGCNQREGVDYDETFAPVSKYTSFRILMSIAATHDMNVYQFDVNNAFPNADLKEDVYVMPPPGIQLPSNKVYKLQKALYGLKQSPMEWNNLIDGFIRKEGFVRSTTDPCIYSHGKGVNTMYLGLYVDDIIVIGKQSKLLNAFKYILAKRFKIKDLGEINHYLGMHVTRNKSQHTIHISVSNKIKRILEQFNMSDCYPKSCSN